MTSNSPCGKILPFETVGVVIFPPGKKGITILIFHLGTNTILTIFQTAGQRNLQINMYMPIFIGGRKNDMEWNIQPSTY